MTPCKHPDSAVVSGFLWRNNILRTALMLDGVLSFKDQHLGILKDLYTKIYLQQKRC